MVEMRRLILGVWFGLVGILKGDCMMLWVRSLICLGFMICMVMCGSGVLIVGLVVMMCLSGSLLMGWGFEWVIICFGFCVVGVLGVMFG